LDVGIAQLRSILGGNIASPEHSKSALQWLLGPANTKPCDKMARHKTSLRHHSKKQIAPFLWRDSEYRAIAFELSAPENAATEINLAMYGSLPYNLTA
jgi:hypothetical protein